VNGKLVLAYSGGLDTSVMVEWLNEKYDYDIVTLTADVGQASDLIDSEKKCKLVGAIKHYTVDAKTNSLKTMCTRQSRRMHSMNRTPISQTSSRTYNV
jgi:argininosuccinate synthase